jgi:hypothetical protein
MFPSELRKLADWMLSNGGLSSWTIISVLVPELRERAIGCSRGSIGGFPHDPSDLARCIRALDLIPDGRARLKEVAAAYPEWKPLVDNWSALESLWRKEKENKDAMAPKCYGFMRKLLGI